jgi:hypothetical protein
MLKFFKIKSCFKKEKNSDIVVEVVVPIEDEVKVIVPIEEKKTSVYGGIKVMYGEVVPTVPSEAKVVPSEVKVVPSEVKVVPSEVKDVPSEVKEPLQVIIQEYNDEIQMMYDENDRLDKNCLPPKYYIEYCIYLMNIDIIKINDNYKISCIDTKNNFFIRENDWVYMFIKRNTFGIWFKPDVKEDVKYDISFRQIKLGDTWKSLMEEFNKSK